MLPLSILTLAILGGFIFVSRWYPLRYYTLRSDGYRLLFTASIAGAVSLFLASATSFFLQKTPYGASLYRLWHQLVPLKDSGKAAIAFLLGVVSWFPLNFAGKWFAALGKVAAIDRAIGRKGDPLEMLLRKALGSGKEIALSLANGKVYVGKLRINYNPAFPMESISLFLSRSGHRDNDTKHLIIDLDYEETHKSIKKKVTGELKTEIEKILKANIKLSPSEVDEKVRLRLAEIPDLEDFQIVIPINEVQSAGFFDKKIYDDHFKQRRQTNPKKSK